MHHFIPRKLQDFHISGLYSFACLFLKFLKGVPDKIVRAITALLFVWIYIYLFYWSLKFFNFQASVVSAAMEIPMSVVALGLCVGFALEIIRCSIKAVNCLRSLFKKGKEEGIQ